MVGHAVLRVKARVPPCEIVAGRDRSVVKLAGRFRLLRVRSASPVLARVSVLDTGSYWRVVPKLRAAPETSGAPSAERLRWGTGARGVAVAGLEGGLNRTPLTANTMLGVSHAVLHLRVGVVGLRGAPEEDMVRQARAVLIRHHVEEHVPTGRLTPRQVYQIVIPKRMIFTNF